MPTKEAPEVLPLWARLRLAYDFADEKEKIQLEKMGEDILKKYPNLKELFEKNESKIGTCLAVLQTPASCTHVKQVSCHYVSMTCTHSCMMICQFMCQSAMMACRHSCMIICLHGLIYAGPNPHIPLQKEKVPPKTLQKK
jgi:hypothetical protein